MQVLLFLSLFLSFIFFYGPPAAMGKEIPKIAVWDLEPRNTPETHARELTSFVVSEITKLKKYEVYSQENVRTLAGWSAERMKMGCTDTKCLLALGQMDIAKLISGSVGKIGKRYTVSLNLFDTQNARSENALSRICESEDELIELIQASVLELLGEAPPAQPPVRAESRPPAARTAPGEYRDPVTGMEFLLVKGGCYQMGDTFGDGWQEEKPVHEVCLNDFYLGKYEVTVGEFRKFVNETGYGTDAEKGDGCFVYRSEKWENDRNKNWREPGFSQDDRHPVVCVSWNDAKAFADWLRGKGGRNYRLPTEAEWEYAARSLGKNYRYSWGAGSPAGNVADISLQRQFPARSWPIWDGYDDGYVFTAPVGKFTPNEIGLYDMTGNVLEWVSDWYDQNYYKSSPKDNPQGPGSGSLKVLRGGSWYNDPRNARASNRFRAYPTTPSDGHAFRLGFAPR